MIEDSKQKNIAGHMCRGVVIGGAEGAMADQLTLSQPGGGGRLCPPNINGMPGFSDLPTALPTIY